MDECKYIHILIYNFELKRLDIYEIRNLSFEACIRFLWNLNWENINIFIKFMFVHSI